MNKSTKQYILKISRLVNLFFNLSKCYNKLFFADLAISRICRLPLLHAKTPTSIEMSLEIYSKTWRGGGYEIIPIFTKFHITFNTMHG